MGALITYGSYLRKDDDLVATSITIAGLDTAMALMASMVLFPFMFAAGLEPAAGPGSRLRDDSDCVLADGGGSILVDSLLPAGGVRGIDEHDLTARGRSQLLHRRARAGHVRERR